MSVILTFDESVKGTTKVSMPLSRLSNINGNVYVQFVMEKDPGQELSLKNVDLVLEVECKPSDKECSS